MLDAAIRIARAEDATLVPAYLIVIPLEYPLDAPMQQRGARWRCRCSRRSSTPRCGPAYPSTRASRAAARPIHALQRLWDAERFDRIVVPAPAGGSHGFTPKELHWMLVHAPSETVILRPDPTLAEGLRLARSLDAVA